MTNSNNTNTCEWNSSKSDTLAYSSNDPIVIDFGINRTLYNKQRNGDDTTNWKTKQGTVDKLAKAILNGQAFMTGVLKDKRADDNIVSFGAIALDIDDGLTLEQAKQHPFISEHCGLIYTSASHQRRKKKHGSDTWIDPRDRYRVVFTLPQQITDLSLWPYLFQIICEQVPQADPSCSNISRLFYGNTDAEIPILDDTKCLPQWVLEEAETLRDMAEAQKAHTPKPKPKAIYTYDTESTRDLAEQALEFVPQRSPGSGNYHECLQVLMALESEFLDDAITMAENWSPSIPGTSWNIPKKIRSIQRTQKKGTGIGTLFHIAKQYGFEMPKKATGKGFGGTTLNSSQKQDNSQDNGLTIEEIDVSAEINKIADSQLAKSEVNLKLNELSQQSGFIPSELRRMYEARLTELEKENANGEHKTELETLFKLESASLNLENHIDRRLAHPISQIADILGTKPEAFLTTLLPVVASLTKIGTRLELIKATGFDALPILYTGIVGESGTAKSPTQKTILKPLFHLQNQYDEDYRNQHEQWLENCKAAKENDEPEPPEPKRTEIWTDDSTSEAIALIQSNQPDDGFLNWRDELSGLIKDNNKYRGKGSDEEKLLSGRDGSPIKVNRASGKRISVPQSGYSITGGTQPDTLRQQIDFNDPMGHWARFLWCILPLTQNKFPRNAPNINIHELLLGIYKQIKGFTATTYKLSSEATDTYANWYDLLESRKFNESRQGLRAVYSKAKQDTGIIALLLHILNAAIAGETPDDTIDNEALESAIAITKFYISQVRLIHSEGDGEDGNSLAPLYRKILDLAERKGSITARDVARSSSSFKNHKPDDIRCLFKELEQMGKAKTSGTGTKLKLSLLSSSVDGVSSLDDDKAKTNNNGNSSHSCSAVVKDVGFSSQTNKIGQTNPDKNDSDNKATDQIEKDKTKTVGKDDNIEPTASTMTTQSTLSQTQQGLENDDKITTNATTATTKDDTKKYQWVSPNGKPRGKKNDLPQHEVDQLVSYYLQQNGESERYHIICAIGVKTLDIDQALKNVAVSRLGRFNDVSTTFWRLEHQEEKL